MKIAKLIRAIAHVLSVGLSTPSWAASVPQSLPLVPRTHQSVDPELGDWLKQHVDIKTALEMTPEEYSEFLSRQDAVSKLVLRMTRGLKGTPSAEDSFAFSKDVKSQLLSEVSIKLASELELSPKERHILTPYLAELYLEVVTTQADGLEVDKLIFESPIYSCSNKRSILKLVRKPFLQSGTADEVSRIISTSAQYESLSHRRKLLDAIATNLPEARRAEFSPQIQQIGGGLALLMRRHKWLQSSDVPVSDQKGPWSVVQKSIRKGDCTAAAKAFDDHLKNSQSPIQLESSLEAGVSIEQCWRSKKRSLAVAFWEDHKLAVKARFGLLGELWADVRLGYLKWAADENKEASKIYQAVLSQCEEGSEFVGLKAKSIYTLGRIAESDGDVEKAIQLYSEYVKTYPNAEDFEFALNSLVVARAANGQWNELIAILRDYLDQQALVSFDQRPVGNMAFSLFWIGRAYLSIGRADMAREMWRRLAAEYYSTFYGALGHFLLEQSGNRVYALEPSRVRGFKLEPIMSELSPKMQDVVSRTLALLRLGLVEEARCEADELNVQEKDKTAEKSSPNTQLVRALVLHASGSWLDAIRIFDALPRTFRNSLPVGFERILFPRRYAELVNQYSKKVGLDPDLVFAVMRQESVFAKEAMSPVGAMGLMQLMPSTAAIELHKLPKNYVASERKSELQNLLMNGENLFDPDVNITLGVHHLSRLLEIYKSPVFALTSYNASPAATIKWKKTIATDDLLVFIERIPYKETRAYVKLILRNYFYYKRWYGPSQVLEEKHLESITKDLIALSKQPATVKSGSETSGDQGAANQPAEKHLEAADL